jgi:hypothetical protein
MPLPKLGLGEYSVYIVINGEVFTYDNGRKVKYVLPEKVRDIVGAGHPYGYVIGESGKLYMLTGDSLSFKHIADNVKLVSAYWNWAVVVHNDNKTSLYKDGVLFSRLYTDNLPKIEQVVSAHYVLFRDEAGGVWQFDWSKAPWKSGTVWYKSADELKQLKPKKIALPGGATDITTSRVMHSTAIVNGEPYSWWDSLGARYIDVSSSTAANTTPRNMTAAWKLPEKIKLVRSTDNTTHVIGLSGKLYGKGNNAIGQVGNGQKHPQVISTGEWRWEWVLWQNTMVEVGIPGEEYVDIFANSSYCHRTAIETSTGVVRFAGYNKFGLCLNGIKPFDSPEEGPLHAGLASVPTFRKTDFPDQLVTKTLAELKAMVKAKTYPPPEPNTPPVPVPNIPPVVNAGQDIEVTLPVESLTLSAEAMDTDGTIVSYSWVQVNGGGIIIENGDTAKPDLTNIKEVGDYEFEVVVKDNIGATAKDSVKVRVHPVPVKKTKQINVFNDGSVEVINI